MPERKLYLEYQAVRRQSLKAVSQGFSAAAKAALTKEIEKTKI